MQGESHREVPYTQKGTSVWDQPNLWDPLKLGARVLAWHLGPYAMDQILKKYSDLVLSLNI